MALTIGRNAGTEPEERWLARLVDDHETDLLRYAARRVGPTRAADVVSETFVAALVHHRRGGAVTAGWLMTVAHNKVVDVWRADERRSRLLEQIKRERGRAATPDLIPLGGVIDGELIGPLSRLRERDRLALVRHYVEGVPIGRLAAQDGVSYSAMESRMARARRALRESLRAPVPPLSHAS